MGAPLTRTAAPGTRRQPSPDQSPDLGVPTRFLPSWEKDNTAVVTGTRRGLESLVPFTETLALRTHGPGTPAPEKGKAGSTSRSPGALPARPPAWPSLLVHVSLRGARAGRCRAPRPGRQTSQQTAARSLVVTSSNWNRSPAPSRQLLPSVLGPGPQGPVSTDQKVQFTTDVAKIRPHGNV